MINWNSISKLLKQLYVHVGLNFHVFSNQIFNLSICVVFYLLDFGKFSLSHLNFCFSFMNSHVRHNPITVPAHPALVRSFTLERELKYLGMTLILGQVIRINLVIPVTCITSPRIEVNLKKFANFMWMQFVTYMFLNIFYIY